MLRKTNQTQHCKLQLLASIFYLCYAEAIRTKARKVRHLQGSYLQLYSFCQMCRILLQLFPVHLLHSCTTTGLHSTPLHFDLANGAEDSNRVYKSHWPYNQTALADLVNILYGEIKQGSARQHTAERYTIHLIPVPYSWQHSIVGEITKILLTHSRICCAMNFYSLAPKAHGNVLETWDDSQ